MFYFRTTGFNGYSTKYSPFYDSHLAVATAANFGLVGNGRLYVLQLTPNGIVPTIHFDTQDGLFDLTWSESHENQLAVASGDGSIKLFDIHSSSIDGFPIAQWHEHSREVFSIAWDLVAKDSFVSGSWDGTMKIWSPGNPRAVKTLGTGSCTYSVSWNPHGHGVVSCVASDSVLRIFDLRIPQPSVHPPMGGGGMGGAAGPPPLAKPALAIHVPGNAELLTHDWNKYRGNTIATGGVDRVIRVFDLRNAGGMGTGGHTTATVGVHGAVLSKPISELRGHEYAIRKLAWSPHWAGVLMSGGYDMSVRIWEDGLGPGMSGVGGGGPGGGVGSVGGTGGVGRMLGVMDKHTEFVAGLDWCLFGGEGWAASVGWDEGVWVWDANAVVAGGR